MASFLSTRLITFQFRQSKLHAIKSILIKLIVHFAFRTKVKDLKYVRCSSISFTFSLHIFYVQRKKERKLSAFLTSRRSINSPRSRETLEMILLSSNSDQDAARSRASNHSTLFYARLALNKLGNGAWKSR